MSVRLATWACANWYVMPFTFASLTKISSLLSSISFLGIMKPDSARPVLLVTRFDECFRFYRDVMGFSVGWGREGDT